METNVPLKKPGKKLFWTGRIISLVCILFLIFDGVMKVIRSTSSVTANEGLGFSDGAVQPMGVAILVFTALYSIPRTAVFGALMLTAHLGGAVAIFIQQFQQQPAWLFPAGFCILLWTGLFLRDEELRSIIPIRKRQVS